MSITVMPSSDFSEIENVQQNYVVHVKVLKQHSTALTVYIKKCPPLATI